MKEQENRTQSLSQCQSHLSPTSCWRIYQEQINTKKTKQEVIHPPPAGARGDGCVPAPHRRGRAGGRPALHGAWHGFVLLFLNC